MSETRMKVASIMEDLEGKIKVLLLGDHGNKALRVESLGPGLDWGSNSVRFSGQGTGGDCETGTQLQN